ncbi:BZ3500_MvSof-1268-A1-R1_Chr2-1g04213 [Microbotryum saponariae]|uniref:BZ3500_MvSof-1268-A1-R1_Chr2-1g04213 protein n=1 Tax=Microbotryum saponariae TaxID=289078 RepID=A0A2X0MAR3_9BASI|nr:BZ3500_MvSof-1268-A1-R1_Chr2-1g04213 [Microbotryum saponariae]SCZ91200.1 BZ3501_MvSof-1269-A2-R1_Chr2-1g03869 [Microbotryum saponariae]
MLNLHTLYCPADHFSWIMVLALLLLRLGSTCIRRRRVSQRSRSCEWGWGPQESRVRRRRACQ